MKDILDRLAAALVLMVLSPLFAFIGISIVCASPGPVFYRQLRVGKDGRSFRLVKFRTMIPHADRVGTSITQFEDPRIFPFGSFLRRYKLDELPQFLNVLIGDMSIVGPRPEVPEIVETYSPSMRRVLSIKPGITSVISLVLADEDRLFNGVSDHQAFYIRTLVPFKVRLGMIHVDHQSFCFDALVIGATILRLFFGSVVFPRAQRLLAGLEYHISLTPDDKAS